MAEFMNPFLKNGRGRIGNMILYVSRGKCYARKAPEKVHNPRTPSQMAQRNKITATQIFYRTVKETLLADIWRLAAKDMTMSGVNLFVKRNFPAFDGKGEIADYAKIHFSAGTLPTGDRFLVEKSGTEGLVVSWENRTSLNHKRWKDGLMCVVVYTDESFDMMLPEQTGAVRSDCRVQIGLPQGHPPLLALYAFFTDSMKCAFSDDYYCSLSE